MQKQQQQQVQEQQIQQQQQVQEQQIQQQQEQQQQQQQEQQLQTLKACIMEMINNPMTSFTNLGVLVTNRWWSNLNERLKELGYNINSINRSISSSERRETQKMACETLQTRLNSLEEEEKTQIKNEISIFFTWQSQLFDEKNYFPIKETGKTHTLPETPEHSWLFFLCHDSTKPLKLYRKIDGQFYKKKDGKLVSSNDKSKFVEEILPRIPKLNKEIETLDKKIKTEALNDRIPKEKKDENVQKLLELEIHKYYLLHQLREAQSIERASAIPNGTTFEVLKFKENQYDLSSAMTFVELGCTIVQHDHEGLFIKELTVAEWNATTVGRELQTLHDNTIESLKKYGVHFEAKPLDKGISEKKKASPEGGAKAGAKAVAVEDVDASAVEDVVAGAVEDAGAKAVATKMSSSIEGFIVKGLSPDGKNLNKKCKTYEMNAGEFGKFLFNATFTFRHYLDLVAGKLAPHRESLDEFSKTL